MDSAVETMGGDVASRPLRPLVVVTVAALCISEGKLRTLLCEPTDQRAPAGEGSPHPSLELPSRLPHEGISLDDAAREAVAPWIPTGATHVEQLHTWNARDGRTAEPRLEVAYLALAAPTTNPRGAGSGPAVPLWHPVDELPPLPASHLRVLERARERLRDRLAYTNLACRLLPPEFSLTELQHVYEAVQGKELDKRNFRKWVLGNGVVESTPRYRRDGAHRPARLYRPASAEIKPLA